MPTYILLSTLTPEGRRTLHSDPDRLDEVNQKIADFGCEVIGQYAVLGSCDFVTVIQAPDNESVAQSMDHRRKFACSWNPANRPDEGRRVRRAPWLRPRIMSTTRHGSHRHVFNTGSTSLAKSRRESSALA